MLLGIITYTFLSDLKKFLRIVGQMLIAPVYENPELFHLIGVLSVLSVLGIFSVVLLIVNIYKISRRLVDFFFFAEGIWADRSRQNYKIHNTKMHCVRIPSSIPFFRYVTRFL
jgi:hypothetical protein